MRNSMKYLFVLAIVLMFSIVVNAQPGDTGFNDDPQDVPLDGGIIILAVATVGYGIKKISGFKKAQK